MSINYDYHTYTTGSSGNYTLGMSVLLLFLLLRRRALQAVATLSLTLCDTFSLSGDFRLLDGQPRNSQALSPLMFSWWTNIILEGKELKECPRQLESLSTSQWYPLTTLKGSGIGFIPSVPSLLCFGSIGQSLRPAIHCCFWLLFILADVAFLYQSSFVFPAAFHTSLQMLGVIYACKEDRWVTCHK